MITTEKILEIVSEVANEPIEKIVSKSRKREVTYPRFAIMKLSREYTKDGLIKIGRLLGGRDHTSVLHGIRTMNDFIDTKDIQPLESAIYFSAKQKLNNYLLAMNGISQNVTLKPHSVPTC
jgi:chromosomal replication initiation ATPase DnaA